MELKIVPSKEAEIAEARAASIIQRLGMSGKGPHEFWEIIDRMLKKIEAVEAKLNEPTKFGC